LKPPASGKSLAAAWLDRQISLMSLAVRVPDRAPECGLKWLD
jgi:hypothetical protein